jgi:Spy/CpxP family protein refolding chaperone
MLNKYLAILAAIVLLLAPRISRANEIPPGRWWHIPYFAEQLHITEQQKEELDQLFEHNRQRLAELKKQVEDQKSELLNTIDQEHLNENSAIAQMKTLESTRTLLAATHFSYSLEVRKLLGHDRFQMLKTLYRKWPGLQHWPPVTTETQ